MIKIRRNSALAIAILLPILLICFLLQNIFFSISIALVYWGSRFYYAIKDIRRRFSLFIFNLGYFLFMLGGFSINLFETGGIGYFSNSYFTSTVTAVKHASFCVMLSIAVVNTLYIFFEGASGARLSNEKSVNVEFSPTQPARLRQFVLVMMSVSYICILLQKTEETVIMLESGYVNSYILTTSLPSAISHIASLYYIFLFMYWSFMPSKKAAIVSVVLLGLLEAIILASGERGEPISMALTTVLYILIRNRCGLLDIVIKKKYVVAIIVLIPFVFYGLEMLSNTRFQREYETSSIIEGAGDFLESQGGSIKIIANAYDLKDEISAMGGHTFVLGYIKDYLTNNILARMITGKSKSLRTVDDAYSGNNFLQTYGYAYAPVTYLNQKGAGSTYIAEVYQDGGYIFLLFMNVFYAWLLSWIDSRKIYTPVQMAILLNISRYISLLPRGMAMQWFTSTFAIQNIIIFAIVYCFSNKSNNVVKEYRT